MRLGRVRSRRACFSVCHPEPRSPQRPSRRTPILPTHFRFAGFTTERRFARVARSEVEGPALLSVILGGGRRSDRVEKPYTAHSLSFRRFFDGAKVRAGFTNRNSRTSSPSVCSRRQLNRLRKNSARQCALKGHGFRVCVRTVPSLKGLGSIFHFTQHFASPTPIRAKAARIGDPGCGSVLG
jgi:hypothetical protein